MRISRIRLSGWILWWGLTGSGSGGTDSSTTVAPTFVSAVNDVQIVAHADFVLKGSSVQAGGSIFVEAQNVQIIAMQNFYFHQDITEKWGVFAGASAGNGTAGVTLAWQDSTTTSSEWQSISQASSLQAGGNVSINAGGALNVTGSTVTAAGDVTIKAVQVNLAAAQDTVTRQETTTVDSFGILPAMNNGFGFSIGASLVSDKSGQTQISNIGALIGSTGGCVTIDAGSALTAQGSIIEALAGDVNISAPTVTIGAGIDSFTSYAIHREKFVGFDVSVEAGGNNPLSAVQKGAGYLSAAEKTKDPQARLLYEAAAGVQAGQGALNVYNAGSNLTQALASFEIKVGVGVSVSTSQTFASGEWASGGLVLAAGNLGMIAKAGDLTLKGAQLDAFNVTLSAQRDLVLQSLALTGTASAKSSSFSAFAGAGLSFGLNKEGSVAQNGLGVTANVSNSGTDSETVSISHAQTEATGSNWVTLTSGQDTNLYGAEVSGGGITAQVARDLNIISDQDTERMTASQTSWSAGGYVGVTAPSASVNASYAQGAASGEYASVTTTSGLFAGGGGYAVTVGGTTTLTGAALASAADASKNMLTTAALVTKDLANSMNWKASSWGMSVSASTSGIGGIQPGLSQKTGDIPRGLAQATIAPGTVSIVNAALQKSLTGKTPEQVGATANTGFYLARQAIAGEPVTAEGMVLSGVTGGAWGVVGATSPWTAGFLVGATVGFNGGALAYEWANAPSLSNQELRALAADTLMLGAPFAAAYGGRYLGQWLSSTQPVTEQPLQLTYRGASETPSEIFMGTLKPGPDGVYVPEASLPARYAALQENAGNMPGETAPSRVAAGTGGNLSALVQANASEAAAAITKPLGSGVPPEAANVSPLPGEAAPAATPPVTVTGRAAGTGVDLSTLASSAEANAAKAAAGTEARTTAALRSEPNSGVPPETAATGAAKAESGAASTLANEANPGAQANGNAPKSPAVQAESITPAEANAANGRQLAQNIESVQLQKPSTDAGTKLADLASAPKIEGGLPEGYRSLSGLSADAASGKLPEGFSRVQNRETGDIDIIDLCTKKIYKLAGEDSAGNPVYKSGRWYYTFENGKQTIPVKDASIFQVPLRDISPTGRFAGENFVDLANEAHNIYSRQVGKAKETALELFGKFGEVDARAKKPGSAANRLQRAVDNFGAKINNVSEAINNIYDAIGTRIVLKDASKETIDGLVAELGKAIQSGRLSVFQITSLTGKDGIPYLTEAHLQYLQKIGADSGNTIKIETKTYGTGYTIGGVYIKYDANVMGEMQVIGKNVLELAEP